MESANIDHQLQQEFVGWTSFATQSGSGYGLSAIHDWNPNIILNGNDYNTFITEILPNSRELCLKNANLDMSDCLAKYSEMPSSLFNSSYIKRQKRYVVDPGENYMWINPISSGGQTSKQHLSPIELYSNAQNSVRFADVAPYTTYYNFSQVPSTKNSNLDLSSSLVSSSLGLNLAMDLLNFSNSTGGSSSQSFRESAYLVHNRMQQSSESPSNSSNNTSSFRNQVTRTKRLGSFSELKSSHGASKKSCSPLKVRKEKLGDRIAALHRLVAPFGKTDTASVLTEAIGYIQFLQDQIQTLSVPYMKSSPRRKPSRTMQASSSMEDIEEEPTQDLTSRGLCLVPLSFTSYISTCKGGF